MESKTIKLRFREDTAENWRLANPILDSSEPAREIDTGKIKYGDGFTRYNDLPYFISETITDVPSDDKIYGRKNKSWVEINIPTPSQCECGDLKTIDSTQIDSIIQEDNGYAVTGLFKYNTTINDNIKTASNRVKLPLSADKGITSISEDNQIKYRLNEETVNAINTSEINSISINNIKQLKEILLNDFTRILSICMTVKKAIWCNNHTLILKVQEDKTVQVSEVDGGSSNTMQTNDKIFLNCANSDNNIYRLSGVDKYGDIFNLKFNENGDGLILRLYPQSIYETQENSLNTYTTNYYIDKELTDEDVSFTCILRQEKSKLNYYEEPVVEKWIEGTSVWNLPLDTFTNEKSIRDYFDNTTIPNTDIQYQVPNPEESSGVEGMVLGVSLQKQISDTQRQYGVMLLFDGTVSFEYIRNVFEQQWNVSLETGSKSNYVYVKGNIGYIEYTTTQQVITTYNFYIDDSQYTAEANDGEVTEIWSNWINSKRNTISLVNMNGEVYDSTKTKVLQGNGKNVKTTDSILEGGKYVLKNTKEEPSEEILEYGTPTFNFPLDQFTTDEAVKSYFSEDLVKKYNISYQTGDSISSLPNATLSFTGEENNYSFNGIIFNEKNAFEESVNLFKTLQQQMETQKIEFNYYYVNKTTLFAEVNNSTAEIYHEYDIVGKDYTLVTYENENKPGIFKKDRVTNELTQIYSGGINWQGTLANTTTKEGEQTSTNYACFHNNTQEILLYKVEEEKFINIKTDKIYTDFSVFSSQGDDSNTYIPYEIDGKTSDKQYNVIITLEDSSYAEYPIIKIMTNAGGYREFNEYTSFEELTKEQNISSLNVDYFFNLDIDGKTYVGSKSQEYNDKKQKQTTTWVLLNSNKERVLMDAEYVPGTYILEQYGDVVIEQ